jgi:glycosyltransferase involved in cell wall biosynthesis
MTKAAPKLVQIMAGARHGGAELFFERLALGFAERQIDQTALIRPWPERVAALEAAGITVHGRSFARPLAAFNRWQIGRQLSRLNPQIVLSWMSRAAAQVPTGSWVHIGRLGGYYRLRHYRSCDWLVANTGGIADWLVAEGWPKDRVRVLVNFVPPALQQPARRADFATPAEAPLIVALGRLHHNKAFDVLLNAMTDIKDAHLWLAGDGPEKARLQAEMMRLGLTGRVHFLGWQANPQALIKAADLFICPSRHEPFGNVIAEAYSTGTPVLASASQGALEFVQDGKTGLLVAVEDSKALAAAANGLLADAAARRQLGRAGYQLWQTQFSPQQVLDSWQALFAEVTG